MRYRQRLSPLQKGINSIAASGSIIVSFFIPIYGFGRLNLPIFVLIGSPGCYSSLPLDLLLR